jgi:hypothetical protein
MENQNIKTTAKIGAYTALIGTLAMIVGAILWGVSGAYFDRALDNGDLLNYLKTAGENNTLLIANLSIWIIGVFIIGVAGTMMANLCVKRQTIAKIAQFSIWTAIPLVIAAYTAWLVVVVRVSVYDSEAAFIIAEAMGWFASRADWIATILILSIGPALISLAGRGGWVPTWLARWSGVCLFAGLLSAIGMFAGGLTTYGFLIIPVGLGWMIAASFVLFKYSGKIDKSVNDR